MPETATASRIPKSALRHASSRAARWRDERPAAHAAGGACAGQHVHRRHAGLVGAEGRYPEQPRDQDVRDGRQALPDRRQHSTPLRAACPRRGPSAPCVGLALAADEHQMRQAAISVYQAMTRAL